MLHSSYTHAIFTVVLAINDKHTLPVKNLPTISPFGIDGNKGTQILFSPFDINVKENMLPLSSCSIFRRYQILNQCKLPLTGWTLSFEACRIFVSKPESSLSDSWTCSSSASVVSSVENSKFLTSLTRTPSSTFYFHEWMTPPVTVISLLLTNFLLCF
jgi:hypothetical protein